MFVKRISASLLMLCGVLLSVELMAATMPAKDVGKALFVRGAVSVQSDGIAARLLEKHKPIYINDKVSTSSKSFTVIEMSDGSRITLRPNTVFVVDEYVWKDGKGKASYSLLKGGMRALTGLIGKNNPDASTITTPYATMGIRGTEYDARLCEKDCADEMRKLSDSQKVESLESKVVGRVAMIKGAVKANDMSGKDRLIDKGGPIYLGDTIKTTDKSFVVVIFRDDTRLTLRPSSSVVLKDYFIGQKDNAENKFVAELLKGGLRTLTGNIGKQNPDGFHVKTATSTMGIRGTGFDVFYKIPTWVHVWSGAVDLEYKDGAILVGRCEGVTGGKPTIKAAGNCKIAKYDGKGVPQYLKDVPDFMRWDKEKRPDNKRFDGLYISMFDAREHDFSLPGLYVTTYDGHVQVKNVNIGANEALFSNGELTYRLKKVPPFQLHDPYPKAGEANDRFFELFGLFGTTGAAQACEVQ